MPKQRQPKLVGAVWGIWVPDAGADHRGDWLLHAQGAYDGPEAYITEEDATAAAKYWQDDFSGCSAALLCGTGGVQCRA